MRDIPVPLPVITPDEGGLPKLVVDWAQVAGSVLSLLALVLALYAIWRQGRDLASERRLQHELELLRAIAEEIAAKSGEVDPNALRSWLLLLPNQIDFPLTRASLRANAASSDISAFEEAVTPSLEAEALRRGMSEEAMRRFVSLNLHPTRAYSLAVSNDVNETAGPVESTESIVRRELNEAIKRRMASR